MFFHRNLRVRSDPRIPSEGSEEPREMRRRIKVKNLRLSIESGLHRPSVQLAPILATEESVVEGNQLLVQKRLSCQDRLPQLGNEEQRGWGLRQVSVQHRRKDLLLNSILQILKPTPLPAERPPPKPLRQWRIETPSRQYVNEFIEELPHFNSTKHHRAPKVLQNQILKARNNPNVIRRKIFSQDKQREKPQVVHRRPEQDLQKIEIITFSNKFPGLKKDHKPLP